MDDQKCLFCEIIKGNIPSLKVYENESCIAVLSIKPVSKGLVIFDKKTPYHYLLELNQDKVKNFLVLNEKSSFLFTCNRKLFSKGVIKRRGSGPLFLVLNERREILGLVNLTQSGFNTKIDIGYYLNQDNLDSVMF